MVHTLLSVLLDLLWVYLACDMFQEHVYAMCSLYEVEYLLDTKLMLWVKSCNCC